VSSSAGLLRAVGAALVVACAAVAGCAADRVAERPAPRVSKGRPVVFAFGTPEGEIFGSETTRGRVTAVLFVTTFDLSSQVMARRLDEVIRRHRPRANAGAIVLEAPDHATLAEVFRDTLGLSYPVGLALAPGVQAEGPFGRIDRVPSLFVLDRDGRLQFEAAGVLSAAEIERALSAARAP
jgi:hypothetical protein